MKKANFWQKSSSILINALTAGVLSLGATSPAMAEPTQSAEPDWSPFVLWISSYGVNTATQTALVGKLSAGEILDSARGGVPISTSDQSTAAQSILVDTYADGSISVSTLERPSVAKLGIAPLAITGCSVSSGAGYASYSNCLVQQSNGTVTLQFRANYSRFTGGANISWYGTQAVSALYGTATYPSLTLVRASQSGSLPAVVTAHSRYTSWNGASSEDIYLSLRVNSGSAWTTTY